MATELKNMENLFKSCLKPSSLGISGYQIWHLASSEGTSTKTLQVIVLPLSRGWDFTYSPGSNLTQHRNKSLTWAYTVKSSCPKPCGLGLPDFACSFM